MQKTQKATHKDDARDEEEEASSAQVHSSKPSSTYSVCTHGSYGKTGQAKSRKELQKMRVPELRAKLKDQLKLLSQEALHLRDGASWCSARLIALLTRAGDERNRHSKKGAASRHAPGQVWPAEVS